MVALHEVDHKVVQNDEHVLLVIKLSLVLKHLIKGWCLSKELKTKVAGTHVDLSYVFLRVAAFVLEGTRHAEPDCLADVWFTRGQVYFHGLIPDLLVDTDSLQDFVLDFLIKNDFLFDVGENPVDVGLLCLWVTLSLVGESLLKQLLSSRFVCLTENHEFETAY